MDSATKDTPDAMAGPEPRSTSHPDTAEGWRARLDALGEDLGYHERLGPRHHALFVDDGPVLLVAFDTIDSARAQGPDQMPQGFALARAEGWSYLGMIADGETWWRDPAVWGYIDRLVDDAFFEDFDRVVFFGADMGGYAAAAFSVAAPGATVVTLRPQATLDPRLSEWDNRFTRARRLDFTSRYGFAPDMVEGAEAVFLLYDPDRTQDAMHAALFARPHVTRLRCRHMGGRLESELARMGILDPLLRLACEGKLDAAAFHGLFRARRHHLPYLLRLLQRLSNRQRHGLTARLARWALERQDHPRLRAMKENAERQQSADA